MTSAAFSLLGHAAGNREKWLTRFYSVGKEAVRPRKDGELQGFLLTPSRGMLRLLELEEILDRADVEFQKIDNGEKLGRSTFVPMNQPYGAFAKAMLETQTYPDLKDASGNPVSPYDVTAHTLPLLLGVEARPVFKKQSYKRITQEPGLLGPPVAECSDVRNYWIYRSSNASMDEGWTRWTLENYKHLIRTERSSTDTKHNFEQLTDATIRKGGLQWSKVIIFPDQSPNQILNGYTKGSMPEEFTGGIGTEGVEQLTKFVDAGGTIVFLNRASDFAIRQFGLPVKDVTEGVGRKDFFIPGSILRIEIDTSHSIGRTMPPQSMAWFEDSPAFEITTDPLALTNNFKVIARYPSDPKEILLSGWALGTERIAGKAALVEFTVGKGSIVLFGFRPQYRGQSLATFPLFFNAIAR